MAARDALLKYFRVHVQAFPQNRRLRPFTLSSNLLLRRFSEEVRGSFLDKSEVTDRVVSVVKNFQKVEPSKLCSQIPVRNQGSEHRLMFRNVLPSPSTVTPNAHFQNDLGLDSLDAQEIMMALEEEFGFEIPDNEADKINSINLAVDFIASHPQAK